MDHLIVKYRKKKALNDRVDPYQGLALARRRHNEPPH